MHPHPQTYLKNSITHLTLTGTYFLNSKSSKLKILSNCTIDSFPGFFEIKANKIKQEIVNKRMMFFDFTNV